MSNCPTKHKGLIAAIAVFSMALFFYWGGVSWDFPFGGKTKVASACVYVEKRQAVTILDKCLCSTYNEIINNYGTCSAGNSCSSSSYPPAHSCSSGCTVSSPPIITNRCDPCSSWENTAPSCTVSVSGLYKPPYNSPAPSCAWADWCLPPADEPGAPVSSLSVNYINPDGDPWYSVNWSVTNDGSGTLQPGQSTIPVNALLNQWGQPHTASATVYDAEKVPYHADIMCPVNAAGSCSIDFFVNHDQPDDYGATAKLEVSPNPRESIVDCDKFSCPSSCAGWGAGKKGEDPNLNVSPYHGSEYGDFEYGMTFNATVPVKATPYTFFEWDFDDGGKVACGNQSESHTYSAAGDYTVSAKPWDQCGVDASLLSLGGIDIQNPPEITAGAFKVIGITRGDGYVIPPAQLGSAAVYYNDTVTIQFKATDVEGNWGQPPKGCGADPGYTLSLSIGGVDYTDVLGGIKQGPLSGTAVEKTFSFTLNDAELLGTPPDPARQFSMAFTLTVYDTYYGTDTDTLSVGVGCKLVKWYPKAVYDNGCAALSCAGPPPPRPASAPPAESLPDSPSSVPDVSDGPPIYPGECYNWVDCKNRYPHDFDANVPNDWGWGDCIKPLAQQRRYVALRNYDCSWDFRWEVRSGFPDPNCKLKPPTPTVPIIRSKVHGDIYADLFGYTPTLAEEASGMASFGPLYSVMWIRGKDFYNFQKKPLTHAYWLDRLTFTEVWMSGNNTNGVKLAGVGPFAATPIANPPPPPDLEPFVTMPVCTDWVDTDSDGLADSYEKCEMEVQVNTGHYTKEYKLVKECDNDVEIAGVVDQIFYVPDGVTYNNYLGMPRPIGSTWSEPAPKIYEWDEDNGFDHYWITPSTFRRKDLEAFSDIDASIKILEQQLTANQPILPGDPYYIPYGDNSRGKVRKGGCSSKTNRETVCAGYPIDTVFYPPLEVFHDELFRSSNFIYHRADQLMPSRLNQCSEALGQEKEKAAVGYPLSLTMEYDYTDMLPPTEENVTGRECAIPDGIGHCGFGREHQPATQREFWTITRLYNSDRVDKWSTVSRYTSLVLPQPRFSGGAAQAAEALTDAQKEQLLDKEVELYEPGKPWDKLKMFTLVPDVIQEPLPDMVRVYGCGFDDFYKREIAFVESGLDIEGDKEDYQRFTKVEDYLISYDPLGVSRISPAWGDNGLNYYPVIWGHDFLPPVDAGLGPIDVFVNTRTGPVQITPTVKDPTYMTIPVLTLPVGQNNLQPLGTALSNWQVCRSNEACCQELTQDFWYEQHHPAGEGLAKIFEVTPISNLSAPAQPIKEDIPYVENYCLNEYVDIKVFWADDAPNQMFGSGPGISLGLNSSHTNKVWLWRADSSSWAEMEIIDWQPLAIRVKVVAYNGNGVVKTAMSPDCTDAVNQVAEVSNATLPIKLQTATKTFVIDQDEVRVEPPARARIIEENSTAKNLYCLNDRVKLTGSFGPQRLNAVARFNQGGTKRPAARYLKWTPGEIVMTPPAIYSGRRSPFCPRSGSEKDDGLLSVAAITDSLEVVDAGGGACSNPFGDRTCQVTASSLVSGTRQPVEVYATAPDQQYFNNLCVKDVVRITGTDFGDYQNDNRVEFWSNEAGWIVADHYIEWSDSSIVVAPPQRGKGIVSPDCPRNNPAATLEKDVSLFNGAIRILLKQHELYRYLDLTNSAVKVQSDGDAWKSIRNAPISFYKDNQLTSKQYTVGEQVRITGALFSDIRSEAEAVKAGLAQRNNIGYVEFYSEEVGWVPAEMNFSGFRWTDSEIIVQAPAISLEDVYGGPASGVSVARDPVRVCTDRGCVTNLQVPHPFDVINANYQGKVVTFQGGHLGEFIRINEKPQFALRAMYQNSAGWWRRFATNQMSYSAPLDPIVTSITLTLPPNIEEPDSANQVKFYKVCRDTDNECFYWDVAANRQVEWHYPEPSTLSPMCFDVDVPADQLVTVYGQDLDFAYDSSGYVVTGATLKLDLDPPPPNFVLQIYQPPTDSSGFRQQFRDKIVVKIPAAVVAQIKNLIPSPPDPKLQEYQVITGKIYLQSKFYQAGRQEVPVTITFGTYCAADNQCIAGHAPFVESARPAWVGENRLDDMSSGLRKQPNSVRVDGQDIIVRETTAQVNGCNFTTTAGGTVYFGDTLQYRELAPNNSWKNRGLGLSTPFGGISGFFSVNVWTGLMEFPGPWLPPGFNVSQHPRLNLPYTVNPTIETVEASIGPTGQLSAIYGSDFCGPNGCNDTFSNVNFGLWWRNGLPTPDYRGVPGVIFDISPRRMLVRIPTEKDSVVTYADTQVNRNELAISGQVQMQRADGLLSRPLVAVDYPDPGYDGRAFSEAKNYYDKAPILRLIRSADIKRNDIPPFIGVDYYGEELVPSEFTYAVPSYIPNIELRYEYPYPLEDQDLFRRQLAFPDRETLETETFKKVPSQYYDYLTAGQYYMNHPQGVITSNWDAIFNYWLGKSYTASEQETRTIYNVVDIKEQYGYSRRALREPADWDLPKYPIPHTSPPMNIVKVDPLPMLDMGYYCNQAMITIYAESAANGFNNLNYDSPDNARPGKVFFWSDAGQWLEVTPDVWEAARIQVRIDHAFNVMHKNCGGTKKLDAARLPVQVCRYVKGNDPLECMVYDPKTHIRVTLASGTVLQDHYRAFGRFNRLNVKSNLFTAGDNRLDQIFVSDEYYDLPGQAEPPGSDCGDGICDPETGETTGSCPSDCVSGNQCDYDTVCDPGEDPVSCPTDCLTGPVCGDGNCEGPTEKPANCPADCGPASTCGNNICDPSENPISCPVDCGPPTNGTCYGFLGKWQSAPEPYIVDPSNSDGLNPATVVGIVANSIAKWEAAAGADVIGNGSVDSNLPVGGSSMDGKNTIQFGNLNHNGAIAINFVWKDPATGAIVEFDQVYDEVDFHWSTSGEPGKMDFENLATHELGHSFGMNDLYTNECREETMYGYANNGETKKRDLDNGDRNGIGILY